MGAMLPHTATPGHIQLGHALLMLCDECILADWRQGSHIIATMQDVIKELLTFKGALVGAWILAFFAAERLLPAATIALSRVERRWRLLRNGGLFLANAAPSVLVVVPLSAAAAEWGPAWRESLTPWWGGWSGLILDLILLDFLIYWWHRANHEVPLLWRFHEVHHLDETLDTTSALRFHFGEVFLSAMARACFVVAFDIPLASILVFETLLLLGASFHHSNLRLPRGFEHALSRVIITPSIHWVHHHAVRRDTDSNYGTIFSFWDRLFGSVSRTARWDAMPIGVEGTREKRFLPLMASPFKPRKSPRRPSPDKPTAV